MTAYADVEYIYYYDFVMGEYVVGELPDTTSLKEVKETQGEVFEVLAQVGKQRLKVIDIARAPR